MKTTRLWQRWVGLLALLAIVAAACGGDDSDEGAGTTTATEQGDVLEVPADYPTIQEAVDAASPGDLVLISPGVYHESVDVTTDRLTIRGLDRNETILDGDFERENGIRVLDADGVAIENLTARNYTANGFFWTTNIDGYRGSYLTTYRTGDYGIYAFDAVNGLIEHSYASGSPDAGFYIGQCYPCNAVIDDVLAEYNGLGYSGTNSGGDLYIINSTFRYNRVGIVPNSGSYEGCYPERDSTIVGNLVYSNNQEDSPAIDVARLATWNGILVAGGYRNYIARNRVFDHERTGIGLVPFPEEGAQDDIPTGDELELTCAEQRDLPKADPGSIPEPLLWNPVGNRVEGNVVSDSGLADLAYGWLDEAAGTNGNCFAGNELSTSAPLDIEALAPCEGEGHGDLKAGALDLGVLIAQQGPESGDYKTTPIPPPQENMPDAATAPPRPAVDVFVKPDIDAIGVPDRPSGT